MLSLCGSLCFGAQEAIKKTIKQKTLKVVFFITDQFDGAKILA
jgi:hypothetical protein